MPTATYTVEVAWTSNIEGGFVVGTSKVGSTTDLIGVFTITGWVDETSRVKRASIKRGSPDDLGKVLSGQCTLILKDTNGRFNPTNTSSALSPDVVPMRPVRVKATFNGTDYYRFFGYIQTLDTNPNINSQEAVFQCADLLSWLSLAYPAVTANGTTTTTALALTRIMNLSGINDTALMDFDTGDTIADYSSDGTTSALTQIQNLVAAEQGTFYISRAGVATFENRYARNQTPRDADQSTFASTFVELSGRTDVAQIYNSARFTRTSGSQQTVTDDTSRTKYGRRVKIQSSAFWTSDAQAASAATFYVGMKKNPSHPLKMRLIGNSASAVMVAMLSRDLNDRVGVSETRGGTTGSFYIESVNEMIDRGGKFHSADLYLSMRPASFPGNYLDYLELQSGGYLTTQDGENIDFSYQ